MNRQILLCAIDALKEAFEHRSRPTHVRVVGVPGDVALLQIDKDFGSLTREEMSYQNASMMVLDSTLIVPEAFWYFFPRIAELILLENGDYYMLTIRLEELGDYGLNSKEILVKNELVRLLEKLEQELNEAT
ncbi:MAG: hypothetical protein WA705_26280 [Candidatus Ozemobacteraceae bacterium]